MKRTEKKLDDFAKLRLMAQLTHDYKLRRVDWGSLSVEADPAAHAPKPADPQAVVKALVAAERQGVCHCGHSYDDHNEAGCLQGCPLGACVPQEKEE